MNVFRISNFYQVGRNIYPEYAFCTSLYRIDKNIYSRSRAFCHARPLSASEKGENMTINQTKTENVRKLHLTSNNMTSVEHVTTQVLSFFKTIKMQDMKQSPQPIFWYSVAGLLPFLGPPLSFIIFGYSSSLVTMQLAYGATLSSFLGGIKWGYTLHGPNVHEPNWKNLGWSIVPQALGWFGLLLPQSLGYIFVITGIALAGYVDLSATNYPNWFRAIRLAVTVPTLFGLILTLIIHIFH